MSHHTFAVQLSTKFAAQMNDRMDHKIHEYLQSLDATEQATDAIRVLYEVLEMGVFMLDFYHPNFNGVPFSKRHPARTAFLRSIFVLYATVDPANPGDRAVRVTGMACAGNRWTVETRTLSFPFYIDVVGRNRFYEHASDAQRQAFVRALVDRMTAYQQVQNATFASSAAMDAVRQLLAMEFSNVESLYQINAASDHNAVVDYGLDPYALRMVRFFHASVFGAFFARYVSCGNFHLCLYLTKTQYMSLLDIRDTLYDIGLRLAARSVANKEDYNAEGLLDVEGGRAFRRQKRDRYAANAASKRSQRTAVSAQKQ